VEPGRVLGHEAVGTVEQVGAAVRTVQPGDRVLISCISRVGAAAIAVSAASVNAATEADGCSAT
jgi:alcohol dehydrogenase